MLRRTFLKTAPALGLLSACSKSPKIKLALNWKPEPEFGGFYAAPYSAHGLDVDVLPGGSGTPTVQMVGAGSVDFAIVSADEVVLARSHGNDVVALFAVFQHSPTGIMAHASRNLTSIGDVLKGGTLALESGLPFARLLERKYSFSHVKVVPSPGGDITSFLHDENFAQQCFLTSEPIAARKKGAAVKVFAVSEIGYDPYTTVLAISGESLRKNPDRAKAMVAAVREGWRAYLDNPKTVNQQMNQLNPTMDLDTFAEVTQAQKPFIETDDTRRNGLGAMSRERWETLIGQFKELGDISQTIPADECFRLL
ncbi:MAG TPA: ABC transporter substrate-binding protein [Bryobacteraceae bacterium]|jgi:NitT/TauT family transport system substrate-binding protein|nr:ABC transporter substrate-binding protein [Bryobacteraceae bacterium]